MPHVPGPALGPWSPDPSKVPATEDKPIDFKPATAELFMGGEFRLGRGLATVGDLRAWLRGVDKELSGWGDTEPLSETVAHRDVLSVTLKQGIPQ